MATPWAAQHRLRAAEARASAPAPPPASVGGGSTGGGFAAEWRAWLSGTTVVDGHVVARWHLLAAALGVLLVGPSALGYALCALVMYLVYTRVVVAGETPQTLGDAYLEDVAVAAGKQGGRALGRSRGKRR